MLGEVIHGYRIEQSLASDKGGFGDVFFARHVDSGAEAVVKALKPEMSALRDTVERFFNEARAASSVRHPGVVRIHNVGYHLDRAYLLMERLHGDDLETRLGKGPLPVEHAVAFVRQTAGAIGAAHQSGIVHRDLKPANLFVVSDPDVAGGERVKVLDFGIAKLTVDGAAGRTQGVFGTPAYMSPEQCASTAAVDGRADLYSLGCIFYELVCGRPPFGFGGAELVAAHLRDAPPPPRVLAPWLPPAIERVILRLLEKQPGQRYDSCAALIAALDEAAALSGLPAASASQMPMLRGASASIPAQMSTMRIPMESTLGSAAGARTVPPARRSNGLWIALSLVIVVGAGVGVLAASGGSKSARDPVSSAGSGSPVADAAVAVSPARVDAALASDVPGEPSQAKVARLILAGAAAMRDSKYDDAEVLLKEAYAIEERADVLYYLCITDMMRGRCRDARATCELVSQKWAGDPIAKVAKDTNLRILPDSTTAGCYQVH